MGGPDVKGKTFAGVVGSLVLSHIYVQSSWQKLASHESVVLGYEHLVYILCSEWPVVFLMYVLLQDKPTLMVFCF